MMKKLKDIFYNELTLKSDKWLPYFPVYEKHFSKFVGRSPVVVEVGVQGGGSMQMWRSYFGQDAKIYGIDIDERIIEHKPNYDENIKLFVGDQSKREFWENFLKEVPEIDVFIDDGGHLMDQQIMTLECVFPHIKEGGLYLCEDTHTSYRFNNYKDAYTFTNYCKKLTDLINNEHIIYSDRFIQEAIENYKGLYSISFYNSMIVMEKEKIEPFVRDIVNENERFK